MNLGKADCAFNLAVSHFRFANPSEVMRNDAKFAFGGSMDFSKFANIFKEAYQGGAVSLEGLFDVLLCNCLTDEGKKDEVSGYTRKAKENLVNGKTPFGRCAARYVDFFSTDTFETYLHDLEDDIPKRLVAAFKPYIKGIVEENYSQKIAQQFSEIFMAAASDYKNRRKEHLEKLKNIYDAQNGRCGLCSRPIALAGKISDSFFIINDKNKTEIGVCADCKSKVSENKEIEKRQKTKNIGINLLLDDEIVKVVDQLCHEKRGNMILDYSGLKISQKINQEANFDLYHKVSSYVAMYFLNVRDVLEQYESLHPYISEKLSSYFKSSFLTLESKGFSQERIFSCLTDNIKEKCDVSITAAEVLVSYFVQNCEVNHEISK